MKARNCLFLIAAFYVASLVLPAIRLIPDDPTDTGIIGIFCLISVPYVCLHPAWWANVFLLVGSIRLVRDDPRRANKMGMIATGLALSFLPYMGLRSVLPGSLAWIASSVTLAAAGFGLSETHDPRPAPSV